MSAIVLVDTSIYLNVPEMAMRNKSADKLREGVSLADLSIVKEWVRNCGLHPMSRVRVWSLDDDLAGYDRRP